MVFTEADGGGQMLKHKRKSSEIGEKLQSRGWGRGSKTRSGASSAVFGIEVIRECDLFVMLQYHRAHVMLRDVSPAQNKLD